MKEFTHLLFLDADIGLTAAGLKKLISHNKDVIGANVALKGENAFNTYGIRTPYKDLSIVDKVGTAVFMLSRRAVNTLIEKATPYSRNKLSRGRNDDVVMYDVFRTEVVNWRILE